MSLTDIQVKTNTRIMDTIEIIELEPEERYSQQIIRRFKKNRLAVAGLIFIILLVFTGLFAPWLTPHNPNEVTAFFSASPSSVHWLGTDQVGRDVLSRLIYATRISLIVGFLTVSIYVTVGTTIGLISAYYGGWMDMFVMRLSDIFMAFPYLMVILVVVSVLGSSLTTIILVLALFSWPTVARLVRGNVLSLKQLDYVKASIALGLSPWRIMFSHILPNTLGPIIVNATFGIAAAILSEAGLSFLGMGIQPPTPSWGNMLSDAQSLTVLTNQPWLWVPAGSILLLTVLAINSMGDGLRDALDPKQ
ncbi:peptide/nickel transport system permease protein [Paenibacillus sp. DS2015]|uniref:oligopeptide ABC transporter permease n=1 Tax=Paenibacillus sp. DS2015 TaxID=3373917 RepID=UPI003D1BDA71